MPELALALYLLYLALVSGLRSWVQRRRTGSTGWRGISGAPGSAEWLGGVLFVLAVVLGLLAPVVDLAGVLDSVAALDGTAGHVLGIVLALGGLVLTLAAQFAMGTSWRVGVDHAETTALVTDGPFAVVRNPIFAAMIPASLGLALLVPNVAAIVGFVALLAAFELQTRKVEEPYLLATHGSEYARYASRVGRFVPGVGKLPQP
jgi:protein-S-isoprenylcysteine O-methyltransferase Ste14